MPENWIGWPLRKDYPIPNFYEIQDSYWMIRKKSWLLWHESRFFWSEGLSSSSVLAETEWL
jgi:hypothetical protein